MAPFSVLNSQSLPLIAGGQGHSVGQGGQSNYEVVHQAAEAVAVVEPQQSNLTRTWLSLQVEVGVELILAELPQILALHWSLWEVLFAGACMASMELT